MKDAVVRELLAINRRFYQTFATNFSATRMRLQPGVKSVLERVPRQERILDLGCGNGELARWLAEKGHLGFYCGFDLSDSLLEIARNRLTEAGRDDATGRENDTHSRTGSFIFLQGDLSSLSWDQQVRTATRAAMNNHPFDLVFAFATLHHLPGKEVQTRTLQKIHGLLKKEGRFIHSNWQFLNSERLRKRILPWQTVALKTNDVDPGDYLLDWRQGGYGLRYVHHFNEDELESLAEETGFRVRDSYTSDGEGGNLGLYQLWERV